MAFGEAKAGREKHHESIVRQRMDIICKIVDGILLELGRLGFVISHPSAKCAEGWGTRPFLALNRDR